MTSIFHDIATLKWQGAKIEGSGPIAVYLGCDYRVVLCQLPMEAKQIQAEKCCARCHHGENIWHSIVILNSPPKTETPYRPGLARFRQMIAAD